MHPRLKFALGLAVVGLGFASAGHAQLISPFANSSEAGLDQSDLDLVYGISNRINAAQPAPQAPMPWSNPGTGRSGTVRFVTDFRQGEMPCRTLRYTFESKTPGNPGVYLIGWCQNASHEWKISS